MLHTKAQTFKKVLQSKIPDEALDYCTQLWISHPFHFKITKTRKTKSGDFRFRQNPYSFTITLNHDLNPFNFLITYIHEVAHLINFKQHQNNVPPHGAAWKRNYQQLMQPLLITDVFPEDLLVCLKKHFQNPKASTYSDAKLALVLRSYDQNSPKEQGMKSLAHLEKGQQFEFHDRVFEKGVLRRTRVLCKEMKNGKNYLIPNLALVKLIRES